MNERVPRHSEPLEMVAPHSSDNVLEHSRGYPAPETPFEMPTMSPGPAQGAAPASGSDTQSQTTTAASDD